MRAPPYLANFDSATAMTQAVANVLRGEDFPIFGSFPRWSLPAMRLAGSVVNRLPRTMREQLYIFSGRSEAIAPEKLASVRAERVAEWMVSLHPKRRYPAVAIGSSNGAAVHLWAALGVPWLPQTFLMPVARAGISPDEPQADAFWAQAPARAFLKANPDVQLHHMHDPNQDRLMIQKMTYFRVKRRRLGAAYEDFLKRSLAPGGTIFVVECNLRWPTRQYGERHLFQFGALGGATPDEYRHGGPRVEDYLTRYHSPRRRWEPPAPDGQRAEAEWGFEPSLREDVERLAREQGYRVRRIVFETPEDLSPLVADLYRWWYRARGIADNRLLVESFIVMEPYWALRGGLIPFWMVFNKEPSAQALAAYLDRTEAFDEILMMLFSHGVDSIGLTSIEEWRQLLKRARRHGAFVGVDEAAYPRDFAVFARYYFDLRRKIQSRGPIVAPLELHQLDQFLAETQGRYPVQWF